MGDISEKNVMEGVVKAKSAEKVFKDVNKFLDSAEKTLEKHEGSGWSVKRFFAGVGKDVTEWMSGFDKAAESFSKGLTGVSKVFESTLFKGATDLKADYSDLTEKWLTGIRKVAEEQKPAAEKALAQGSVSSTPMATAMDYAGGVNACMMGGASAESQGLGGGQQLAVEKTKGESNAKMLDSAKSLGKQEADIEKNTWDKKLGYAASGAGAMANILQNLYVATGSKSKEMFKVMQAAAIAETIIQTYRAAQGAYAALASVHPVLGIAAAAAALAAGMARVKQIKATKMGTATASISAKGTANPTYQGGSASAYPVPTRLEEELPTQHVTINIHNPLSEGNWDAMAEDIVETINRAGDRNVELSVMTAGA